MKLLKTFVLCILLSFGLSPVYAESQDIELEHVQNKVSEAFAAIGDYSVQQRDQAVKKGQEALNLIDSKIEHLEQSMRENWQSMSDASKQQATETMQSLQEKRNQLSERYGALKHGTDNAWDELKNGFVSAWGELKTAWQKADDSQ